MKEYRIIRTDPSLAIVNVQAEGCTWTGYTNLHTITTDIDKLRAKYPEMVFEAVEYIALAV